MRTGSHSLTHSPLRCSDLRSNFLTGTLPAELGALGLTTVSLETNLLDATSVPAALCAAACAAQDAFLCTAPLDAACGAPCAPACVPACPAGAMAAALAAPALAIVAAQCTDPATACVGCLRSLVLPLIFAGVPVDDNPTLGGCIKAHTLSYVEAGATPAALAALTLCGRIEHSPATRDHDCPLNVPAQEFEPAVAACADDSTICTACAKALAAPFAAEGVVATDAGMGGGSITPASFARVTACALHHTAAILAAGVSPSALAELAQCSWPAATLQPPADDAAATAARRATAVGAAVAAGSVAILAGAAAVVATRRRRLAAELATAHAIDAEMATLPAAGKAAQ